ncbi:WD40-repeat-containing domain protein [Dissophora ornata]|nr:WD40-repeat-containing domain protein [Dissophora ornata]
MASASLSIPIAFWTKGISIATISSTLTCADYVVAGLEDGLIWVLKARVSPSGGSSAGTSTLDEVALEPSSLLIGHNSRVTALEAMLVEGDTKLTCEWILVSASEDGEVKKWNLADGRCLQSNPGAFIGVPEYLGVFSTVEKSGSGPKFIVCSGTSNEACILDSTSLEIVRVWGGHLDWVYCASLPASDQHQSRILSVSTDCKLSMWIFDTSSLTIVKSKVYDICTNTHDSIVALRACRYDASWVALVTRSCAQIVCIQPQKKACYMIPCPENESLAGADFISTDKVILWTQSGRILVYSVTELQLRGGHATAEGNSELTAESSYNRATVSSTPAIVNEWKLHLGYLPSVLLFKSNGQSYLLNLRNSGEELLYSSIKVRDTNTVPQESKGVVHEVPIQWNSNKENAFPPSIVSYSVMLNDTSVALGCNSGDVWVTSIDEAQSALASGFKSEPSKETRILKGHVGPITSIFTSDDLMLRSFLLTGGEDCSARIWNIESGTEVACFNNHSRPVAHFLQAPEDVNSRMRRSVISIAEDHSVAVISIEEMNCIYLFGGYEHALLSIQWRPPEDYIVLWHADETAFVWQMQTGHLDRIIKGESAREIMMDSRWSVCEIPHVRAHSSKLAFDCITVPLQDSVGVQTIVLNLKHILSILSSARVAELPSDYPTVAVAPVAQQQSSNTPDTKLSPRRQRMINAQSKMATKAKASSVEQPAALSDKVQKCLNAAKAGLSLLITEDDAHAISIRGLLGLSEPVRSVALGMRGAYGNISIQAPSASANLSESWCVSPTMTASKLIAILALSKIIAAVLNLNVDMDMWAMGYCNAVQDVVGPKFCPPSLSYLAKYWQDPQVEIQEATKIILLSAIERMSKPEISTLVKYWSAFLPAAALPDTCSSQYMARSAIILGILGAENAEALPEKVRKLVALSLTILLNDDSRVSYKIASIDLLAQGFGSWQPFIRADAVLTTLFGMATDTQTSNTLVTRRARRAIAQIAIINPALFVATLTQDIVDAKKPTDRMGLLKLISIFSRKNPTVLYNGIPRIAEAIVKSLDPTVPQIRELLLPVATSVMLDLVHSFPQLDFHVGSQKLAVGTLEGAIIVYDLQTATRWQILEGHLNPVSAVSFSRDGKTIVSCSIKEGTVRLWHPNPGFFGMLMGGNGLWGHSKSISSSSTSSGGGPGHHSGIPSLSSQQSSRTFDFALQDSIVTGSEESMLSHVRFEWTGDRAVKLSVFDHIMSFNV